MANTTSGAIAQTFTFSAHPLRIVLRDGNPWFVASDVCEAIGIKNHRDSVERLDGDEKGVASTDTLGGAQEMLIVNESGLNAIILRCRDAMTPGTPAHKYRKWVTSEVLPAIRKTGRYEAPTPSTPPARERINNGDLCALIRVVGMIGDHFHQHSAWTQGIWFYLRKLMGHPAPQPWYVDQLPEMARHLTSAYADAIQVRALVLKIESEACKRIFRHGEASSVVLADLQRLCQTQRTRRAEVMLQDLPKWAQLDMQAITDRTRPAFATHSEAAEQINYFDQGASV